MPADGAGDVPLLRSQRLGPRTGRPPRARNEVRNATPPHARPLRACAEAFWFSHNSAHRMQASSACSVAALLLCQKRARTLAQHAHTAASPHGRRRAPHRPRVHHKLCRILHALRSRPTSLPLSYSLVSTAIRMRRGRRNIISAARRRRANVAVACGERVVALRTRGGASSCGTS